MEKVDYIEHSKLSSLRAGCPHCCSEEEDQRAMATKAVGRYWQDSNVRSNRHMFAPKESRERLRILEFDWFLAESQLIPKTVVVFGWAAQ